MKVNHIKLDKLYKTMGKDTVLMPQKDGKKQTAVKKDSLVLSSMAKGYCEIDRIVNKAVDEVTKASPSEKLLQLKNEIARGTYHVPADTIASAIVDSVDNKTRGST